MDALSPKNLTQAQKEKLEGLVDKHTVNTLNTLRSVIKENKKRCGILRKSASTS